MRRGIILYLILIPVFLLSFLLLSCSREEATPTTAAEITTTTTANTTDTAKEPAENEASAETSIEELKPLGFVSDFANIFTEEEKSQMESFLSDFEKETTAVISVVTIDTLGNMSIERYALELFNTWGIGKKDVNNGMQLLISMCERQLRISIGSGLESVVTNDEASKIIDDIMPYFRQGKYGQGAFEGVKAIADEISKDI